MRNLENSVKDSDSKQALLGGAKEVITKIEEWGY